MERVEAKLRWTDEQFKRRVGTTKEVFHTMLRILQDAYDKEHALGGSPPKISVADRLLITMQYYREYRTMEHISTDFDCSKCTVFRAVRWVEQTLAADASRNTSNDCRRCHGTSDSAPQKNQEEYDSGKKKRHTLKSQITADAVSGEIYSV